MTKILLAEDDDSMRLFLAAALRRAGHEIQDYADGESALSALEREVFDLLLTDIVMPGLDGIKAAQLAANLDYKPKIILMSGYADQVKRATEEGLDVFAVVDKPLPLRVLVRFVQNALNDLG